MAGAGGTAGAGGSGGGGGHAGGDAPGGGGGTAACTTAWCAVTIPADAPSPGLLAVSVHAGEGVWISGRRGTALRGDAAALVTTDTRTQADLQDIWGSGPDDAWAVGPKGLVLRWDGKRWSGQLAGTAENLHAVSGSSSNDVWIGGDSGAVAHWDGERLEPVQHDCGTGSFDSIVAAEADDVYLGSSGGGLLHWDGESLSCDRIDVYGLAGVPGHPVWVMSGFFSGGQNFAAELYHGDLDSRVTGFQAGMTFTSIWAAADDDVWLAGLDGILARGSEADWDLPAAVPGSPAMRDMDGLPGGRPWIVGDEGYVAYLGGE